MPRHAASSGPARVATGFLTGTVSPTRSATKASVAAPNKATASRAARQPSAAATTPPSAGLASAITPRPDRPLLITRTPSLGSYRSRTIARAQTTAAAMQAPCTARHAINVPTLSASALATLATVYSASPTSSTGRRPWRSASGPHTSWPRPKQMISADSVSCAAAIGAPSSRVSVGSAGRYRSVVTGWMPSSRASARATMAGLARPRAELEAPAVSVDKAMAARAAGQPATPCAVRAFGAHCRCRRHARDRAAELHFVTQCPRRPLHSFQPQLRGTLPGVNNMKRMNRWLAAFVATCISYTGAVQSAQAALVGTQDVAAAQGVVSADVQAEQARAHVNAILDRADVAQGLAERGVSVDQARARVAALSDFEVAHLAKTLDEAPAGANDILGVIVFIFVLLLITDILGFTKIFPFTRSIR